MFHPCFVDFPCHPSLDFWCFPWFPCQKTDLEKESMVFLGSENWSWGLANYSDLSRGGSPLTFMANQPTPPGHLPGNVTPPRKNRPVLRQAISGGAGYVGGWVGRLTIAMVTWWWFFKRSLPQNDQPMLPDVQIYPISHPTSMGS